MNFTNLTDIDKLKISKSDSISAKDFAAELIKHTYHNGLLCLICQFNIIKSPGALISTALF